MAIFEYLHRGGPIMYLLVVSNIASLTVIVWKWMAFRYEKRKILENASLLWNKIKAEAPEANDLEYVKERIGHYVHKLEQGLQVVKIVASTSPLLGLLGTVLGILVAFETISQQGLGKPELFARGIAMALVTTAGGLLVAIPNTIFYNVLMAMLINVEHEYENIIVPKVKTQEG